MTKGTFFRSNWFAGGITVTILLIVALLSSLQGGLAIEFGGLEMTLAAMDGALNLSLVEAS
jgi:hypothetical protein